MLPRRRQAHILENVKSATLLAFANAFLVLADALLMRVDTPNESKYLRKTFKMTNKMMSEIARDIIFGEGQTNEKQRQRQLVTKSL
jgi:hypothetical protein